MNVEKEILNKFYEKILLWVAHFLHDYITEKKELTFPFRSEINGNINSITVSSLELAKNVITKKISYCY